MKILQSSFLLIGLALCLWACQSEEPEPAPSPDPAKRLKKITWNEGATSEYTYDAQGRLLERYDQGAYLAFAYRYGFEYDAQGRLVSSHLNSLVFYAYAYDAAGRLRQAKETDHQGKWTYQHHFEYNASAQLIAVLSEVPLEAGKFRPDKKLVFAYDPQGKLEKMTSFQFEEAEETFRPLQWWFMKTTTGKKRWNILQVLALLSLL
ncbi:MAG: hypothetical protein HC913_21225 [Microscillaceae bacterium]|nr:hypothetical protein [Microscillaceae bacterium]